MGNIENKNQINSQETTNKAREKTEAGINSVDKTKLANNISTQGTKGPENKDIKEVWKDTDLVKDKFPKLNNPTLKTILIQYHVLSWDQENKTEIGFDTLKLQDLYKLPATAKANLAYLSTMLTYKVGDTNNTIHDQISKTDFMKQNNITKDAIELAIKKTYRQGPLSPEDLSILRGFRTELEKIKHNDILSSFTNMFPAGADVPPMPDIIQLAAGDSETTIGIGGGRDSGRWLFDYNETGGLHTNIKKMQFGVDTTKPMNISVIPSGADAKGVNIFKVDIKDPNGKNIGSIRGRYSARGTANNMQWETPTIPGVTINNNTISIPSTYKDSTISVMASAYQIAGKNFDETNFSLSIDNGRTLDASRQQYTGGPESYTDKMTDPMKLGEFELTDLAKNTINSIIDKSLYFGNKTLKKDINLNLTIAADATAFDSKGVKGTIVNYQNIIAKQKNILVNQLKIFDAKKMDAILSKLQPDDSWKTNPDQYKAQKALLDCRFLTTLNQIIQNKDMVNAIKTGKFTIVANSASDGKYIKLEPDAMNYAKPLNAAK